MQCNNSYANFSETFWLNIDYSSTNQNSNSNNNASMSGQCLYRRREPSILIFAIYVFVVPSLAVFGLCANFINAIVFMRPKMTPSAFTYLASLSWLDCLSCILLTLTALSRSIFFHSSLWLAYDMQWQTPLFGITTGAANLILACVSLDRLMYLRCGIPNGSPRLCRRIVARCMVVIVIFISFAVNIPYFFVFVVHNNGTFSATKFYYSRFYQIHNWFSFILLTVLPALFLLIGSAAILIAFRRWTKQSQICHTNGKTTQKRYQHQMKLTVTILIVITLYMIGELPSHLTARKCALNLLYSGDVNKIDFNTMERVEVICMTLNALQLSMNILVYALINPSFMPEFFVCLRSASDAFFRFICFTRCYRFCRQHCNQNEKCTNSTIPEKDCCSKEDEIGGENNKVITGIITKRSKSVGNFGLENEAFEKDYLNDESSKNAKRNSVPIIFLEIKLEICERKSDLNSNIKLIS